MSDPFESWLTSLNVTDDLADALREARKMVETRMQSAQLTVADGWQVGFRAITPKEFSDRPDVRYYFVPVCVEEGVVVDVRPDLSHTIALQ